MSDHTLVELVPEYARLFDDPQMHGPVGWLSRHGVDPRQTVADAVADLQRRRGGRVRLEARVAYAQGVVLNQFFHRWALAHQGQSMRTISWSHTDARERELLPFLTALIASSDHRSFERSIRKMARRSRLSVRGPILGDAEDYAAYVGGVMDPIGDVFLSNFDAGRRDAAFTARKYLQMVAVSFYLKGLTGGRGSVRAPELLRYLTVSTRIDPRTVLAVKLSYCPAALTSEERRELKERYGYVVRPFTLMKIQDVAHLLRYPHRQALYRKLHKVRGWAREWVRRQEGGAP